MIRLLVSYKYINVVLALFIGFKSIRIDFYYIIIETTYIFM